MAQIATELQTALASVAEIVNAGLGSRLDRMAAPSPLGEAMRHAVLAGGKRLRPYLLIECAGLYGVAPKAALPAALALECLHTYSLVHDDLPAMDDDDVRRGQPTVHRAFDEATAILAGDGLLTLAFEILAEPETHSDPGVRIELISGLARAAGGAGMVGGQMLDLAYESQAPGPENIAAMQGMKTGALFHFACVAGGILGGASPRDRFALAAYAGAFGRAFQITDDLLDTVGNAAAMGKRAGKDAARGKATLVGDGCVADARAEATRLIGAAESALEPFGERAEKLVALARHLLRRDA